MEAVQSGGEQYVGFWPRAAARIIDNAIVGLCGLVIAGAGTAFILFWVALALHNQSVIGVLPMASVTFVLYVLAAGAYFVAPTAVWGQTLGKKFVGLKVVSSDGSKVTWGQSVVRFLVDFLFMGILPVALVGFLDPLWVSWDKRKQAIHDKAARTRVIRLRACSRGAVVAGVLVGLLAPGTLLGFMLPIAFVALLPAFSLSRENARQVVCKSNLHSIALALALYRQDHGAYPPPYDPLRGSGGLSALAANKYLRTSEALRCPDDPTRLVDYNRAHRTHWNQKKFNRSYSSYNENYNYWGYNAQGQPLRNAREAAGMYHDKEDLRGQRLWVIPISSGPSGPAREFPGLVNKNAPDDTIITHCPRHQRRWLARGRKEIIVRLGGEVGEAKGSSYDWVTQPTP
jgi:uncharacterized RDD family membrane protein YckC